MKYLLIILSLVAISFDAESQCCPYVNSTEVIPPSPTTIDTVRIVTSVTTPNQGMFIYSSHNVNGLNIEIEACYFSGFLTATQTYFDTLTIGVLTPGNYDIDFTAYQASDTVCNYTDTMTLTSNFTVIEHTGGLTPISNQVGEIYPNPSSGSFTIELPEELKATHLLIRSISGKLVHQGVFKDEMNLILESGTYFIEFWEDDSVLGHQRLVIH